MIEVSLEPNPLREKGEKRGERREEQCNRRIGRAGCCGGFLTQWLWWLQSDTLGLSPAVAVFSLFLGSNETSIFIHARKCFAFINYT